LPLLAALEAQAHEGGCAADGGRCAASAARAPNLLQVGSNTGLPKVSIVSSLKVGDGTEEDGQPEESGKAPLQAVEPQASFRILEEGLPGASASEGSSDCSGCSFVGDMRCGHLYAYAFYHGIVDCLFPMYSIVRAARNASITGLRCFAVLLDYHAKLLKPLTADMPVRILSGNAKCRSDTVVWQSELHNMWEASSTWPSRPLNQGARQYDLWDVHAYPGPLGQGGAVVVLPVDCPANAAAIREDASRLRARQAASRRYVVLITREGARYRQFTNSSKALLEETLRNGTGLDVVPYLGSESTEEVIRLFSGASCVVGFHGAGFGNLIFASQPTCAVEITLANGTDIWRTNDMLTMVNPKVSWRRHTLDVQRVLENPENKLAFEAGLAQYGDASAGLQRIKTVNLNQLDIGVVLQLMQQCLLAPAILQVAPPANEQEAHGSTST